MVGGSFGTFTGSGQEAKGIEEKGSRNTIKYCCPYYKIFVEGGTTGIKANGRNTLALQRSIQWDHNEYKGHRS